MKRQYDPRQRNRAGLEGEVYMVGHETVGVETKAKSALVVREAPKVELAIRVVSKDLTLLVAARDDVVHRA
jgi:hypothetical protein